MRGEAAENTVRADFQMSERHAILEALRPIEEQAAKERQRAGGGIPGSGKLPEPGRDTRDRLGAYVGLSGRTVEKLDAVMKAAEADPWPDAWPRTAGRTWSGTRGQCRT